MVDLKTGSKYARENLRDKITIENYKEYVKRDNFINIPEDELNEFQIHPVKAPEHLYTLKQVCKLAGVSYSSGRKYASNRSRLDTTKRFPWQTGYKFVRFTHHAVTILKELVEDGKRFRLPGKHMDMTKPGYYTEKKRREKKKNARKRS